MPNAGLADRNRPAGGKPPAFFFLWAVGTALVLFILLDNLRPPEQQYLVRFSVSMIEHYQADVSEPLGEKGVNPCRFNPSCSRYARTALLRHGFLKGGTLSVWRILRCNPFYGNPPINEPVPQ